MKKVFVVSVRPIIPILHLLLNHSPWSMLNLSITMTWLDVQKLIKIFSTSLVFLLNSQPIQMSFILMINYTWRLKIVPILIKRMWNVKNVKSIPIWLTPLKEYVARKDKFSSTINAKKILKLKSMKIVMLMTSLHKNVLNVIPIINYNLVIAVPKTITLTQLINNVSTTTLTVPSSFLNMPHVISVTLDTIWVKENVVDLEVDGLRVKINVFNLLQTDCKDVNKELMNIIVPNVFQPVSPMQIQMEILIQVIFIYTKDIVMPTILMEVIQFHQLPMIKRKQFIQ